MGKAHIVQRRIEWYHTRPTLCVCVCISLQYCACVCVLPACECDTPSAADKARPKPCHPQQDVHSNTPAIRRVQNPAVPRGAAGSREHREAPRRPRGGGCHGEHQTSTLLPCCGRHCPSGGRARDVRQLGVHAAARRMHGRHAFILHLRPAAHQRGGGRQCRGQGRVSPDHAPIPPDTPLPIDMFTGMLPRKKPAHA